MRTEMEAHSGVVLGVVRILDSVAEQIVEMITEVNDEVGPAELEICRALPRRVARDAHTLGSACGQKHTTLC